MFAPLSFPRRLFARRHRTLARACPPRASLTEPLERRLLMTAGDLDTTFGAGAGFIKKNYQSSNDAVAVARQSDGHFTIAGASSKASSDNDILLARFNADGTPDTTFGTNGSTILALPGGNDDIATAITTDSADRYIVAGLTGTTSSANFFVARFTPAGALDTSFNPSGTTPGVNIIDFGGADAAGAVLVGSSGSIYAVGTTFNLALGTGLRNGIAIAKLTTGGTLDPTFGTGGITFTAPGLTAVEGGTRAVMDSTGRLVVGGFSATAGFGVPITSQMLVARFMPDGTLDPTFGTGGRALADFAQSIDFAVGIAVDPTTGNIAASGTTSNGLIDLPPGFPTGGINTGQATAADFAVLELQPNGTPVSTFGSQGKATADFKVSGTSRLDGASAVAFQSDGKIVASGGAQPAGGDVDFATARFNTDGTLDPSFNPNGTFGIGGTAGEVVTDLGGSDGSFNMVLFDSKILEVGHSKGATNDIAAVQYLLDGGGTGGPPTLSISNVTTPEGNDTHTLAVPVTLSAASTTPVTVKFATSPGTALAPSDYTATSGTLTFAPGETTKNVNVVIKGDTVAESDESFTVTLSDPSGATLAAPTATVTLTNDDTGPAPNTQISSFTVKKLPQTIIGGQKNATGDFTVTLANTGTGNATGAATVDIFQSVAGSFDPASATKIGTSKVNGTLRPGKSRAVPVHVKFPAVTQDTMQNLFAVVTAPGAAGTLIMPLATPVNVQAATVALSGSLTPQTPKTLRRGRRTTLAFNLTNNGNVTASSKNAQFDLIVSDTSATPNILGTFPVTIKLNIPAGKTQRVNLPINVPTSGALPLPDNVIVTVRITTANTTPPNSTDGTPVSIIPVTLTG